jgi:cytochrome c553
MPAQTIDFWTVDEAGAERLIRLPARWAICGRCHGNGTHDAWSGGMTRDEMDEQGPEFLEDYLSGMYDVACTECGGSGKVLEPDVDRVSDADLEAYHEAQRLRWECAAEVAAERRMGA